MRALTKTLAVARLTTLITEDTILDAPRTALQRWGLAKPQGSLPWMLAYLTDCNRCSSVYASGVVLLMELHPAGRALVNVLAGSQAALGLLAAHEKLEH